MLVSSTTPCFARREQGVFYVGPGGGPKTLPRGQGRRRQLLKSEALADALPDWTDSGPTEEEKRLQRDDPETVGITRVPGASGRWVQRTRSGMPPATRGSSVPACSPNRPSSDHLRAFLI